VTEAAFELTVAGKEALSVTTTLKLQLPVAVEVEVRKGYESDVAPLIGE
jgi:hypothetical protein